MAAEIIVQPGNSIQNAVNNSGSGDVITVKPGTYTESLKVSKSNLTIRSESGNPDDTIIKARSKGTNVLLLQGSNIKINGFKIIGASSSYAGINLSSCSNCIIENNKLLNNSRGIYLLKSSGITISRNNAANSGEYGIALQGSTGNTISGNTASDNQRGVYLGTSDENTISSNTVQSNSVFGFFICGLSDKNRIYDNYFNNVNMTIRSGQGNSYSTAKTAGTNIVGGPYIGGNFWGKPDGTGFSQTAVDRDGDGISDSAYTSITGSIYSDYLPLVTPGSAPILPVTDFSSNVTSGIAPLNAGFTDKSTGAPTSWVWSFGDGTNSTQQNPVHTYSSAGNYTVTLTATNAQGSNTTTKAEYIKVQGTTSQVPVAEFSASPTSGNVPLSVSFTDASTNTPAVWNWNFGDGTSSAVQNPAHTYSTAGDYTVALTVSNSAGNNTITKSGYIKVTANSTTNATIPVVSFWGSRTSGTAPLTITFTDASTNTPTAWNWNFGDGTYSTVQKPRHTYSNAGTYSVTLSASNAAGTATKTRANYIKVTAASLQTPTAAFSASPTSGNTPLSVTFTDSSTGTPNAWNWNFGDGTSSAVQNPVHTYSTAGDYTVALTVSNSAGNNTTTKSGYIKVTANSTTNATIPVVSFWGSRTSGTAPLTITFTDASTNTPTEWNWNFGDGTYSTVQKPRHTYSKAGTYSVTLSASNAAGTAMKTRANYIKIT
ncbi:PKD domain-containing protein [Methanosarcina sp.]|uniref:right-handed parallel beta-helix repeat-containing protein n=1 Tax=Methanosarcina sp. TaxID=2213 RepID=UPI003C73B772